MVCAAEHIDCYALVGGVAELGETGAVTGGGGGVAGDHDDAGAEKAAICSQASLPQPLRGGSTIITSGRRLRECSIRAASAASAQMNSQFVMPFARAFCFAFSIASGTISTPIIFFAVRAIESPIVPAPQYRSSTVLPFGSAKSQADE